MGEGSVENRPSGFAGYPGMIPHAQHVKVFQPVLEHVDELVIAVRIGRHHEEAVLQDEIAAVTNDSFDDLIIALRVRRDAFFRIIFPEPPGDRSRCCECQADEHSAAGPTFSNTHLISVANEARLCNNNT